MSHGGGCHERPVLIAVPIESVLDGNAITGTVEVEFYGPASVTTSLGACLPDASLQYQPWSRSRAFLCAGEHRIVVALESWAGPPITGTVSNWRTVTRYEVVETCTRYETTEEGGRVCVEWKDEHRTVNERVGGSGRFRMVENDAGL